MSLIHCTLHTPSHVVEGRAARRGGSGRLRLARCAGLTTRGSRLYERELSSDRASPCSLTFALLDFGFLFFPMIDNDARSLKIHIKCALKGSRDSETVIISAPQSSFSASEVW